MVHRFPFLIPTATNTPPLKKKLTCDGVGLLLGIDTEVFFGLFSVFLVEDVGHPEHVAVGYAINMPFDFRVW